MMGKGHATSGAAVWLAVTSTAPLALGLAPQEPLVMAAGMVVAAGAALLPDIDHHNATAAHSIPVIGKLGASAISGMVGGHRHGTHSLIAAVVFPLLAYLLQYTAVQFSWWPTPILVGAGLAVIPMTCFAVKVLGVTKTWLQAWGLGFVMGVLVLFVPASDLAWVSLAISIGAVTHLAGDFLTVGGLPLLWPWNPKPPKIIAKNPVLRYFWMPNGYFAFPILGKTGSWREFLFTCLLAIYAVLVALVSVQQLIEAAFA